MKTYTIDCKEILDRISAHEYIADILKFPEYYGKNLDALFDCLTDMGECTIKIINIESLSCLAEYKDRLLAVFKKAVEINSNLNLKILDDEYQKTENDMEDTLEITIDSDEDKIETDINELEIAIESTEDND